MARDAGKELHHTRLQHPVHNTANEDSHDDPGRRYRKRFFQPSSDGSTKITAIQGMDSIDTSASTMNWTGVRIEAKSTGPKIRGILINYGNQVGCVKFVSVPE